MNTWNLLIWTLCASVASAAQTRASEAAKPNVIFILADDLGWSDTTLYGTTKFYQTPNIERLAQRGVIFHRAYSASPLCSPTRASILTGQSPARIGITAPNCHLPETRMTASVRPSAPPSSKALICDSATRLDTRYVTLAERLKDAGYATGHFGKWHLGPEPYSPLEQGFDVDVPHWPGPGPAGSFVAPWKFRNFQERSPGEHIEDRMAAEAVAFIEQHRDRPFCLNYWQFSVHAPFDAKKELIAKHRTRVDPSDPQRSPTYAAMVESLDDAVGALLDTLDRLGLADRTAVIFFSDNGGNMYNEVDGTTPTSNAPLRGGKATMFEGGLRVPCIVQWPGVTRPGTRSEAMIQSTDFYPTILRLLDLPPTLEHPLDGVDIGPSLRGEAFDRGPMFTFFPHQPRVPDHLPPAVSLHRGDWKLIRLFHEGENGAHAYHLYNLAEDVGETRNLAAEKPELVAELDRLIAGFLEDTKAVVPTPNPAWSPAAVLSSPRAGWTTSKDTQWSEAEDQWVITSTGNDPWIATRALPVDARGPFTVRLRLQSRTAGKGVVYFATPARTAFHLEQSVSFVLEQDGQWHDYEIKLPPDRLTALRLDPGNAPGTIRVASFTLFDGKGQEVKRWLPAATR
ncbi:MAG: sulfatase [Pirellulaceae bacterium]|nr:sulfatase [Pirellulaceae bacterium]